MTMIIITNVIPDHLQHEVLLLEDAHLIGQPLQLLSFRSLINLMIIIITCLLCVSDHFHHYSWKENPNVSAAHHAHDHDRYHLALHIADFLHPLNLLLARRSKRQCLLFLRLW